MSKTDAMRAMREARYARLSASRTTTASPARRPAASIPSPASAAPATASAATTAPDAARSTDAVTGRCGHRSMNGRSCTREAGHVQKNHRYG